MYFTDASNQVKVVSKATGILSVYAGNGTINAYGGENVPAISSPLQGLGSITGDLAGNLYIVTGYRIMMVYAHNRKIVTLMGNGISGSSAYPLGPSISDAKDIYYDTSAGFLYLRLDCLVKRVFVPVSISGYETYEPTSQPSNQPSSEPSLQPSTHPSSKPTIPTCFPSSQPSLQPSSQPSMAPSNPTAQPSRQPSQQPSVQPSSFPTLPQVSWQGNTLTNLTWPHLDNFYCPEDVDSTQGGKIR